MNYKQQNRQNRVQVTLLRFATVLGKILNGILLDPVFTPKHYCMYVHLTDTHGLIVVDLRQA